MKDYIEEAQETLKLALALITCLREEIEKNKSLEENKEINHNINKLEERITELEDSTEVIKNEIKEKEKSFNEIRNIISENYSKLEPFEEGYDVNMEEIDPEELFDDLDTLLFYINDFGYFLGY